MASSRYIHEANALRHTNLLSTAVVFPTISGSTVSFALKAIQPQTQNETEAWKMRLCNHKSSILLNLLPP
jgi:hypothetical protein